MGSGMYSAATYKDVTAKKIMDGTTFGYSDKTRNAPRSEWKTHESLAPTAKNSDGVIIRESRDGGDHPESVPIVVGFDDTGSMGVVPRVVQQKLTLLFGLLIRRGFVQDPQIMISAYGDAYCDAVPLQVSQFESDNRIDDNLDNLFLEGGGGGNGGETSTMLWYYLANHTAADAWEKRRKKGYVFIIGDERALPLKPEHITQYINSEAQVSEKDLTAEILAKNLQEKWEVYILLIDNAAAKLQRSCEQYSKLFGKRNVLIVEDPESIAETIALAIGALEGTLDKGELRSILKDENTTSTAIVSATNAVAGLFGTTGVTAPDLKL
ncbi:hypothetical protein AGMMS49975_11360 [Clostridia bacterium]|nr:hypothetical protein AGMMS49975_11360 [Clostridia bacterium]